MAQGNGTKIRGLTKRGGVWHYRWQHNGRRKSASLETSDENTAIAKVLEIRQRPELLESGSWRDDVNSYVDEMTARNVWTDRSAEARRYVLYRAGPEMRAEHPREVTTWRLQQWYDKERKRLTAPETAHQYFLHVKGFMDWMMRRQKLDRNPADGVELSPFIKRKRDRFVTSERVAELLAKAEEREDPELVLILLLGFECGMRRNEIVSATPNWIDLSRGVLTIPAEAEGWCRKNKRSVSIPLVKRVRDFFAAHPPQSPYLVRPEKVAGRFRYRYDFRKKFELFMTANGEQGLKIHDMRRSFGSNRVSAGVSLEKVSNWLGIRPTTAWDHYARFIPLDDDIEKGAA